jgi:transmembrane sensor
MDELARELASLSDVVEPAWDEARSERLFAGVAQLRTRRRRQRVVIGTVLSLMVCLTGALQWQNFAANSSASGHGGNGRQLASEPRGLPEPGRSPHMLAASSAQTDSAQLPLQLADGSHVHALARGAAVVALHNEASRVHLRLDAGGARFDVIPNAQREFVVNAGSVEVSVLGTIFEVERDQGRVRVAVTRGKVRVRNAAEGADSTYLLPGESGWFPDVQGAHDAHDVAHAAVAPAPETTPRDAGTTREAQSERSARARIGRSARRTAATRERQNAPRVAWRSLSQSGDYEGAYRLLQEDNAVDDDSGALLDAADAARLSGHPQAAVLYLRKVVDHHRETPVAPLAAFTLGRVLLERLGQPSEAAEAFLTARRLAPEGSLAQDALAREVEAWSKAGHPDQAYRCAQEYVEKYPQGRRLRSVQLYGGMQVP